MGGLFSKPKMPDVKEPPPIPVVDQSIVDRNAGDLMRKRRGRAATDLASSAAPGAGTTGAVAAKQLLGG